jgi:hypothetical protein
MFLKYVFTIRRTEKYFSPEEFERGYVRNISKEVSIFGNVACNS